ncbi:hypothetical protein OPT61_g8342 [Boeremia exigua]|uniref:Uncharacterized protein n=1 Tax=Boeremia exigua TaxID=749465 RepID=A0ACC2HZK4_9PLEO|nr:hypothetical protein OPT61_g8342 [Boeremia exigua]
MPSTRQNLAAYDSLSLALSTPISPSSSPTPTHQPIHTAVVSTSSKYPRASPPSFLYPHPIVPPHVYVHTMQHNPGQLPRAAISNGGESATRPNTNLPTWLTILILAVITIAGCWSIAVCAVHHRGLTTGMSARRQQREQAPKQRLGWWERLRRLTGSVAKKRQEYEALRGEEMQEQASALASGLDGHASLQGASPVNPFLVAPGTSVRGEVRRRGSVEWAEQHRAFFGNGESGMAPGALFRGSTSGSLSEAELACIESEAREAQDGRAAVANEMGSMGFGGEESKSWVDLGLAAVDEAVDKVAAKIVRWADDGGRDEELVLPLAKGKQD